MTSEQTPTDAEEPGTETGAGSAREQPAGERTGQIAERSDLDDLGEVSGGGEITDLGGDAPSS